MATNPQLVMRSGPNPGKTFSLTKPELYIGRDISNDIVINDAEISRKHVRLLKQGDQYVIEDLGSTNGTFINGQRIAGAHLLTAGESLQMGENVVLVFEEPTYDPDSTAVMTPRQVADLDAAEDAEQAEEAASMPEAMAEAEEAMPEPEPEPMMPMSPMGQTMGEFPGPFPGPSQTMAETPAPPRMMEPQRPAATYTGPPAPSMPAAMPAAMQQEEPPKKSNRRTLIAGCGCLVIILCIAVIAGAYYIDAQSLWCQFPFIPGC